MVRIKKGKEGGPDRPPTGHPSGGRGKGEEKKNRNTVGQGKEGGKKDKRSGPNR